MYFFWGRILLLHKFLLLAPVLGVSLIPAHAQTTDAKVCDIINHPAKYDGKVVRISGLIETNFDSFIMRGDTCSSVLWLSYPAGTKAKSGPAALLTLQPAANAAFAPLKQRPAVTLEHNKDFDTFDMLLSQKPKTPGICIGCVKNDVTATLVGRIDGTDNPGLQKDSSGKITALDGFGNMSLYPARMVIQSVSDVAPKEIDYSKTPKVSGDSTSSGGKDFVGGARKAGAAFPKGSDPTTAIEASLAALGAPGQDSGVTVDFGDLAGVPAGESMKAAKPEPEGILFTIRLDPDKLKGDAESIAIAHQGAEIVELRKPSVASGTVIENKAWQTALYVAIGLRLKTVTLPGGTVVWSDGWTQAERSQNAGQALSAYLDDREETPH